MINKSVIKLEEEGFNNFHGREEIESVIKELFYHVTPVDLDEENHMYWQNDNATLVVEIESKENVESFQMWMEKCEADEFDTKRVQGKTIVRVWWD